MTSEGKAYRTLLVGLVLAVLLFQRDQFLLLHVQFFNLKYQCI